MTRTQFKRLEELLVAAGELPPDQRRLFIRDACGGDQELMREAEALLPHLSAPVDAVRTPALVRMIDTVAERIATDRADALGAPVRIGQFRILRRLGAGGMGVVYEGEQSNPRRMVALKVLQPGQMHADSAQRLAREADVLGRLKHVGIAHIYEAGSAAATYESGYTGDVSYIAMELIEGVPLTTHAAEAGLTIPQRLELIASVSDAVQHAHDRGILHRDLKPSNILVDASGQPKILDFGIARWLDVTAHSHTFHTGPGGVVGTIPYMSPEQVIGQTRLLDARSDVYSLGVILYELLSGRLPHDVRNLPLAEAIRVIHDEEPSLLASLDPALRGDVSTITAKAMAKEPERRYATARDLAADIRRFLSDQPIVARPTSLVYQLRKFAKRNRGLVGGVCATLAALTIGLIGVTSYAIRAARERILAQENERSAIAARIAAERASYRGAIATCTAALRISDIATAERALASAPQAYRGWEWRVLQNLLDESTAVVETPDPGLFAAGWGRELDLPGGRMRFTYTHDRSQMAWVSDAERTVTIYSAGTGTTEVIDLRRIDASLTIPQISVINVSISGRRATAVTDDGYLCTVDLDAAASGGVRRLEPTDKEAFSSFSEDGRRLLHRSDSRTARVWALPSGALVGRLDCSPHEISCGLLHDDGHRAYIGTRTGAVLCFDVDSGRRLAVQDAPRDSIQVLRLGRAGIDDTRLLAAGSVDGAIYLWDEWLAPAGVLHGHRSPVRWLSFDAAGERLVSYDSEWYATRAVRIWSVDRVDLGVLRGHQSFVYAVAFSADGRRLASGGWDGFAGAPGALRIWDPASGECLAAWCGPEVKWVTYVACTPDGSKLVAGLGKSDGGGVAVFDIEDGRRLAWFSVYDLHPVLALHPRDEVALVAGLLDNDVADSSTARDFVNAVRLNGVRSIARVRAPSTVSLAWSPDGERFAAGSGDGMIRTWDGQFQLLREWRAHDRAVLAMAYDPSGRLLASASRDGSLRVWDVESAAQQAELPGHTDEIFTVAWHPDGSRLASGGRDRVIRVWDTADWQETVQLSGHHTYVRSLCFDPSGTTLASASGDRTIRLWRAKPSPVPATLDRVLAPAAHSSTESSAESEHRSTAARHAE